MKKGTYVTVHLVDPGERLWGRLNQLDASGVIFRGIDVNQVEAFKYQVKGADRGIFAQTYFFPMRRVLKIDLDEAIGELPSLVDAISALSGLGPDEIMPLD